MARKDPAPTETITSLTDVLDRLEAGARRDEHMTLGTLVEAVGRRSFAPLLLFAGVVALSPLSGIPTVPSVLGVMVILVAGQLVAKRRHLWLPQWMLRRRIGRSKVEKAVRWLRRPARWIDGLTRPRLEFLTRGVGAHAIALVCVLIAATMPPLEILPFAATTAGAAITCFGLSLIVHDGLVALVALAFTLTTGGFVVNALL